MPMKIQAAISFFEVPGLRYFPGVLSGEEQATLLHTIDLQPWRDDLKRRVQHYGWRYDYRRRQVTPEMYLGDLPDWLLPLSDWLHRLGMMDSPPQQAIANEYHPGQGISPHTDASCFGPVVASLSLGSPVVMDFCQLATEKNLSLFLEPGSLVVLADQARYEWSHGIAHRKTDPHRGERLVRQRRVSLTFRTVPRVESIAPS